MTAGAIVVFAKCPIPGSSKTRLSIIAGDDGSAYLAKAMLSDVLMTISHELRLQISNTSHDDDDDDDDDDHVGGGMGDVDDDDNNNNNDNNNNDNNDNNNGVMKFLVYAPGDSNGEDMMMDILSDLGLSYISINTKQQPSSTTTTDIPSSASSSTDSWCLIPMLTPTSTSTSSDDGVNNNTSMEGNTETIDDHNSNANANHNNNLRSTDLGSKLASALLHIRAIMKKGFNQSNTNNTNNTNDNKMRSSRNRGYHDDYDAPIVFLGMDAPEIPIREIAHALTIGKTSYTYTYTHNMSEVENHNPTKVKSVNKLGKAYLNPAHDGGYGMLCVPSHAPPTIFNGVRWSSSLTAVSQLKALSDNSVDSIIGSLMNDIDEPEDLMNLAVRLCMLHSSLSNGKGKGDKKGSQLNLNESNNIDRLSNCSEVCDQGSCSGNYEQELMSTRLCPQTFDALLYLGLVQRKQRTNGETRFVVNINKFEVQEL